MKNYFIFFLLFFCFVKLCFSQNEIILNAQFYPENEQIKISQTLFYKNISQDTLTYLYLNDWNNSYANKNTPLANRFAEEYKNDFHFAKNEDRGFTTIKSITQNNKTLNFLRDKNKVDILQVELEEPLKPNQTAKINFQYTIKIPNSKFNKYGVTNNKNLHLNYWYLTPAVYKKKWILYSNKDLNDAYTTPANYKFTLSYPEYYQLTTNLNKISSNSSNQVTTAYFEGNNQINCNIYLTKKNDFQEIQTDYFTLISNINAHNLQKADQAILTDKVAAFITKNLGEYPHERLLISEIDYKKNPIYGLNLLPDFIRPFPDTFQYELKILKTALRAYLQNTLLINPRKDYWLIDGIQIYFFMKYVEENYPDTKILGSLSKIWGIKSFHAAQLNFNEQYQLLYLNMARDYIDQPLSMQKDSLLKFNKNIANPNKAAIGLQYLNNFDSQLQMDTLLKNFITTYKLKPVSTKIFENYVKSKASKNIDWFFSDYLKSTKKIDYKIVKVKKSKDSLNIKLKNKHKSKMPIALYSLKNDSVLTKNWITSNTLTIPNNEATKLVLNRQKIAPEINQRNNTKSLTHSIFNKPLQVRLFKDVEDTKYNQLFLMPIIEYNNIYDGLILGAKAYNKTALKKTFTYKIEPQYATNSNTLTGSANAILHQFTPNNRYMNKITYALTGSYSSYAENLFVTAFKPNITFQFRDTKNLRDNKRQYLNFRYISINRDTNKTITTPTLEAPNYNLFNIKFVSYNPGMLKYNKWFTDFQVAQNFSKISFNYEFRHLFNNNRQLNWRFFVGAFLKNKIKTSSNYFSFALDRPTDYLFDYDYLGRSESTGIFSQQIIIAEGGFKSKLNTPFANQWLATTNLSTSIWQYIHAYGDLGLVKNKNNYAKLVYDSGVRINLVEDYFEIYFPVYSNLGWEITQPNYSSKIRFIFTADLHSLLGLFRRRWY